MAYDIQKNIELYLLKADNCDPELAPNQKKYYLEVAEWLRENNFSTATAAAEAMKQTEYYEGGGIAQTADDIELRIKAMEKVGYDEVAEIHRMRRRKFAERGNSYAFSQEWLDDYSIAEAECSKYAERKSAFGRIFSGYCRITGNPQRERRIEAAQEISAGLKELQAMGTCFDELASEPAYWELTMTTERGMENFISFIHDFDGTQYEDDISDIEPEQEALASWIESHKEEVMAAGKQEQWKCGCAFAVPSGSEGGYDFIAVKEVDQ